MVMYEPLAVFLLVLPVLLVQVQGGVDELLPCDCERDDCYCVGNRGCLEVNDSIISDYDEQTLKPWISDARLENCPTLSICCPLNNDLPTYGSCGRRRGNVPWMVAVENSSGHICGATLVHPRVAVTNVNCVKDYIHDERWRELKVSAGFNYKSHSSRASGKVIEIKTITGYSEGKIAILILDMCFPKSYKINWACVPTTRDFGKYTNCEMTGWLREGKDILKSSSMSITKCKGEEHDTICAKWVHKTETCVKDFGSSLVCGRETRKLGLLFELVGIASPAPSGIGVCNGSVKFIKLAAYRSILTKIPKACPNQRS